MSQPSLPLVDTDDLTGERTDATVHGVLLAAGTSSRYGDANKLLTTMREEPLIYHAARTLVRSETDSVTVVLGHESDRVRNALGDLEVFSIVNEAYKHGQSTSVRTGARVAQERNADAVLIALGDMPDVSIKTVNSLLEAYEYGAGDVIAPAYNGQRGNPVLFDSRYFDLLINLAGDIGGRNILLSSNNAVLLEVADPGVLHDVDQPSDL